MGKEKEKKAIQVETLKQFVLEENLARYELLLKSGIDEKSRLTVRRLIRAMERELALLLAASVGACKNYGPAPQAARMSRNKAIENRFQRDFETSPRCYLLLDPRPGLHVVDINDAFANATMTMTRGVAGRRLFEVFPDNPDDADSNAVSNLFNSIKNAAETRRAHSMPTHRYDIRDGEGRFVERYWRSVHTPITDDEGRLIYLLDQVEDVTSENLAG